MKPLSYKVVGVGHYPKKMYHESDVRDAVLKFKQRRWFCYANSINCDKCNTLMIFGCQINKNEDICTDCALEQDFGKELTYIPVGNKEILGSPNRDSSELSNPTGNLSCEYRDEYDYFCLDCGGYYCKSYHCSKEERKTPDIKFPSRQAEAKMIGEIGAYNAGYDDAMKEIKSTVLGLKKDIGLLSKTGSSDYSMIQRHKVINLIDKWFGGK